MKLLYRKLKCFIVSSYQGQSSCFYYSRPVQRVLLQSTAALFAKNSYSTAGSFASEATGRRVASIMRDSLKGQIFVILPTNCFITVCCAATRPWHSHMLAIDARRGYCAGQLQGQFRVKHIGSS